MDGTNTISAEAELKRIEERKKELLVKVKQEREDFKFQKARERAARDKSLAKREEILNKVQKQIFEYKKLGKTAKFGISILENIIEAMVSLNGPTEEDLVGEPQREPN